jgi:hypothetical protein
VGVTIDRWFELELLDRYGITHDREAELTVIRADIPALQAAASEAHKHLMDAMEPPPAWHPAHDNSYDNDNYWSEQGIRNSGILQRNAALANKQALLVC